MLDLEKSIVIMIDIQEKLIKIANDEKLITKNISKILQASKILNIPLLITEQYPKGLGSTLQSLKDDIPNDANYFEKTSFSALANQEFKAKLTKLREEGKTQVVIFGIETHICVLQTIIELLEDDFSIYLLKDCSTSRSIENHDTAINLLQTKNVQITTVEITLFEWLKSSTHPKFKEIQNLIK